MAKKSDRCYPAGPRPRSMGHRGAAAYAPENTIVSFLKGCELGADVLELDVHATRDWVIVICHDETVDRTTNGQGLIREMVRSDLSKLDAGYRYTPDGTSFPFRDGGIRIPTLLELLEACPDIPLNIEIKQSDPPIVDLVVGLLKEHGREASVNLAAENAEVMQAIRASDWAGTTGYSLADGIAFMDALGGDKLDAYDPPGAVLQVPERWHEVELVNEMFVRGAHQCGLEVHVWTVNDLADMDRLLALGVDGLITDYPDRARSAIDQFLQAKASPGAP